MMPLATWEINPLAAMCSYWEKGALRWQLYHKPNTTEVLSQSVELLELGNRVFVASKAENAGQGWYREDVIISRGFEAQPGVPFSDFLAVSHPVG